MPMKPLLFFLLFLVLIFTIILSTRRPITYLGIGRSSQRLTPLYLAPFQGSISTLESKISSFHISEALHLWPLRLSRYSRAKSLQFSSIYVLPSLLFFVHY